MHPPCSTSAHILYLLRELNNQISPKFERCTGISQSRLELLYTLYKTDEMSQTVLQKEVNIDGAAITRHLKQLEADGKVVRRKNPIDNRVTLVQLTTKGRQEMQTYCKERDQFIGNILTGFQSDERTSLLEMLKRMQYNAEHLIILEKQPKGEN